MFFLLADKKKLDFYQFLNEDLNLIQMNESGFRQTDEKICPTRECIDKKTCSHWETVEGKSPRMEKLKLNLLT